MSRHYDILEQAAELARSKTDDELDLRSFYIAAIGIRNDGVKVSAQNSSVQMIEPEVHAEARLCRKLTPDSVVYVARVFKNSKEWAVARPCRSCRDRLRSRGVSKVYFTIEKGEFGFLDLDKYVEKPCKTGIRLDRFAIGRWHRGDRFSKSLTMKG